MMICNIFKRVLAIALIVEAAITAGAEGDLFPSDLIKEENGGVLSQGIDKDHRFVSDSVVKKEEDSGVSDRITVSLNTRKSVKQEDTTQRFTKIGKKEKISKTAAPSDFPSGVPSDFPSGVPTPVCYAEVVVELTTDIFNSETSWYIIDPSGQIIFTSPPYTECLTTFSETIGGFCRGLEYIFVIEDVIGDGICCDWGDGSFIGKFGELILFEGGEMDSTILQIPFTIPLDNTEASVTDP